MDDWFVYDRAMRCTLKVGRGYGQWNIDEGVTVHAIRSGVTACGVTVGCDRKGWFSAWRSDPVTCRRCLRVIQRAA